MNNPNYSNESSQECWHCSLVSYKVSYLTAENMHHLAGYILPGLIFSILGLRWSLQLIWEWNRQMLAGIFESSGLPPPPPPGKGFSKNRPASELPSLSCCFFSLPWEGIVKLVLTGLGIVVSVLATSVLDSGAHESDDSVSNVRYATVYLFFALSGLTDILVYYCGYAILPEGVQSFILTLAFSVEALMFAMRLRFEGYLEQQIHALLVVAIVCCAISCAMEVLYDNRLVKFCRAYLCLVQGTWLIHGGCIMQGTGRGEAQTYPDSLEWVSILFAWHVAGNFVLFILTLLLTSQMSRKKAVNAETDPCCIQVVTQQQPRQHEQQQHPASPSPHSSSSSFQPQQHHSSPTTIQTNVSPAFSQQQMGKQSFIQTKQLPPPPPPPPMPSSTSSAPINTVGLTVVPTPSAHSNHFKPPVIQYHQQQYQQQQQFQQQYQPDPQDSRASSAALQNLITQENESQNEQPNPPVIVDSVPRDRVVVNEEYRTLTREDELRQSIKLKESSLI